MTNPKEELEKARQDKYLEIITYLNKKRRQGERNIFDCGPLGFALIWWHHSWEVEWFMPNKEFI